MVQDKEGGNIDKKRLHTLVFGDSKLPQQRIAVKNSAEVDATVGLYPPVVCAEGSPLMHTLYRVPDTICVRRRTSGVYILPNVGIILFRFTALAVVGQESQTSRVRYLRFFGISSIHVGIGYLLASHLILYGKYL